MKKLRIFIIGVLFLFNASGARAFQATVIRLDSPAVFSGTTQKAKQAGKYLQFGPAVIFSHTGSLQQYTVPTTGLYQVTVSGAQGGGSPFGTAGGNGATISGTFRLTAGTMLDIVVGGQGGTPGSGGGGGGGGGGSFVFDNSSNTLLMAAGGGGGGAAFSSNGSPGVGGTAGGNGSAGSFGAGGTGGNNGNGGNGGGGGAGNGGGGAGWLTSGGNGNGINSGSGGNTKPTFTGGSGFAAGGYGGGGAAGGGGGGGGGYSGGGGGGGGSSFIGGGGGGGSFIASSYSGNPVTNTTATTGANSSNGSVSITFLPPNASSVSISGRVLTGTKRGLMNAVVYLTDSAGYARSARTNAFGYYRFEDVAAGQTVILTVVSKRYQFVPQILSVTEEINDFDFVALAP